MEMNQDAFDFKYKGSEGALPVMALQLLLEDYAQVKGKTQMYADAESTVGREIDRRPVSVTSELGNF